MSKKIGVIVFPGSNCDDDAVHAELPGDSLGGAAVAGPLGVSRVAWAVLAVSVAWFMPEPSGEGALAWLGRIRAALDSGRLRKIAYMAHISRECKTFG